MHTFLITNGKVYDPLKHTWECRDVYIENGKIAASLSADTNHVIDASGCIVMPGLIDYHVHYYLGGSENGVNPDASSFPCGITTAVDGGTVGVGGYELYRRTIVAGAQVRLLNYLLIASGGQSNDRYPENLDPALFDENKILRFFEKYGDNLVAIKTRISNNIISPAQVERSLKRTVEIAQKAGTRVVVHVTDCSVPLDELAAMLRPGDVICHIYQGRGNTCLDENGNVLPGLWKARERGVLFDASNGRSNYDLEVCRKAVSQGFVPDIISSDNNTSSWFLQPMHVLPRILSKYLDFGMDLADVLDTATIRPAELIGMPSLACMAPGTEADLAVFSLAEKEVPYRDLAGHAFTGHKVLVPQMTFKDGQCVYCQADFN